MYRVSSLAANECHAVFRGGGLVTKRCLLVEIRGAQAATETHEAEGRGVLVPDEVVDDDRDEFAHVADHGEVRRGHQLARHDCKLG